MSMASTPRLFTFDIVDVFLWENPVMRVAGFFVYLWLMPITTNDITGTLTFSVSSDLKTGTVTYTGTTDYAGFGILLADVVETVSIIQPDGMPIPSFTVNPATSRSGTTAMIPNSSGLLQGNYALLITAVISGPTTPGTYPSRGYLYEFCPGDFKPSVEMHLNCKCAALEVEDVSNYTDWTITSRTLSITCPPVTGGWGTISTSSATLSTSPNDLFNNVTYTVKLVVTITNGLVTITDLTNTQEILADCPTLCEMQCALDQVWRKYKEALPKNSGEAANLLAAAEKAFFIMGMYAEKMDCGSAETSLVADFWDALKITGVNGDCCDCCTGTSVIRPACGGGTAEGTSYNFFAYPVDMMAVTQIGNDITHTFLPDPAEIIRNSTNTTVTSSDGSVTVTPSTAEGLPPVVNYDLSVAGMEKYWYFTVDILFDTVNGQIDSWLVSSQRKFPATGFWSPTDPVIDSALTGPMRNMRIRNLFANPVKVDPLLKWNITMVLQTPTPANDVPTIHLNAIAGILFQFLTAGAGLTAIDVLFEDRRTHSVQYGDIAWHFTGLPESVATELTAIRFNVELRTV